MSIGYNSGNNNNDAEDKAGMLREQQKATTSMIILASGMALWALSVVVKGGYTEQPEYHDMWRSLSLIPALWGIILLIIYRYSWSCVISAVVMVISGGYLATAPTVQGYAVESKSTEIRTTSRNLPMDVETKDRVDTEHQTNTDDEVSDYTEEDNNRAFNNNVCKEIVERQGRVFRSTDQCSNTEIEQYKLKLKREYCERHNNEPVGCYN